MHHQRTALAVLLALGVAGCGGDSEGRSQASAGAATLLPVRVPEYKKDKGLIAAAAAPEEAAPQQQPAAGSEVEEVAVDNSSANAAVDSLLRVARAGAADRVAELLVEEQAEAAAQVLEAIRPLAQAAGALRAALDVRFPNHAIVIAVPDLPLGMLAVTQGVSVRQVDEIDEARAEAILEVPNPSGEPSEVRLEVEKIEDAWRVRLPDFQAPEDLEALRQRCEPIAQAVATVTERLRNDGFADEQAAGGAVEAALKGEAPPEEGEAPASESDADGAGPADGQSAAPGRANTGSSGGGDRPGDIKVTPTAIPVVIDSGGL